MAQAAYRTSADERRWSAVGSSTAPDAAEAGTTAVRAALQGPDPRLLVVFASDDYDLETLLGAIRAAAPEVPLVGCTTAGEIRGADAGDRSVVVTALGGAGFAVATRLVESVAADPRAAGAAAAAPVADLGDAPEHPHRALLMLTDGLSGDQQEIVRGVYAELGATVPIVGGCAGDAARMVRTRQLHDDTVTSDAVVTACIASDSPLGIGVEHGWRPVGERMLVTASSGNRVDRLDDRPALDAYLEALGAPPELRDDPEAFRRFAMTHPLGMERRTGTEVRFIADVDVDEGALVCIAGVPQGELAWVLEGDDDSVLNATVAACSVAADALDGRDPIGVLAFDCIARRSVLGEERLADEIGHIRGAFPDVPLAGFYTYGEFARVRGARGFHNQTLVVLAMS